MQPIIKKLSNIAGAGLIFTVGFCIGNKSREKSISYSGNLRIDTSESKDEPYIMLELTCPMKDLCDSKEVVLKVVKKNYTK